jgi:O-antigen/teichoic acid export membrane protein
MTQPTDPAPVAASPASPAAHSPATDNPAPGARTSGVLRGAHITLLGSGLGGVLAIVNEIICARYLGVNSYGLYAFALIVARIAEGLATLGLPVGALHFIAIYRDQNKPRQVLGTIVASVLPPLLIGGLFSLLLWGLAPLLADKVFGNVAAVPYVRAMALAIPFMGLSEVLGVITRGFGYAAYYVVVRGLVPPLIFLALLLFIMSNKGDPHWVPIAFCTAYVLAVVAGVLAVAKVGGPALFRLKPEMQARVLYGYCMPVLANQLLYLVVACTPILMLGVMQTDKEVGIFRACMQLVIPFDMVVLAFNAAAGNHYAVLTHQQRPQELAVLVRRITGYMAPLAMGWLLVLGLNRHELMLMMGPAFVDGASTLLALAFGHAVLCSVGTAGYLLVMSGRQRFETINAGIAAVVCVGLNLWLTRQYGSLGAALATSLACVLVSALRIIQVRRLMGLQILRAPLWRTLMLAGAAAAVMLTLMAWWPALQGGTAASLIGRNLLLALVAGGLYWCAGMDASSRAKVMQRLLKRGVTPKPPA